MRGTVLLPERFCVSPRGKTSAARPDVPLQISNPDKVFWPDEGYTKLDLIRFYVEVFEPLKPYVKDRLLSLERRGRQIKDGPRLAPCNQRVQGPEWSITAPRESSRRICRRE